MRGLCACWYWVMEHAEDTFTLPKTTAKLRNSVSHFSYRQIQPSWKPGKSQEWGTTIVSFINATNLNQPIQTFDSSVLQTEKWELSWVHSLPPTWPRPLAWKQEQEGGDPINFAPVWPHLGSAFGLFQWRIPCGGLSILVVFSPLVHSPNAFFLSGQIFQRASYFMDSHDFWQHPWTAESSALRPQGSCCQQRFSIYGDFAANQRPGVYINFITWLHEFCPSQHKASTETGEMHQGK